jgi:hypothetical protein
MGSEMICTYVSSLIDWKIRERCVINQASYCKPLLAFLLIFLLLLECCKAELLDSDIEIGTKHKLNGVKEWYPKLQSRLISAT